MIPIIILAGGLATRLNDLTKSTPKSLVQINGTPFVIHQLNLLKKSGFSNIHFCLGHLGEQIENEIKKHPNYEDLNISFSYDGSTQLGTGGAIGKILDDLPDYFFVTYGDSYLKTDYNDIISFFEENKKASQNNLMTLYKNNNRWDHSNVIFDGKKILCYSKKKKLKNMIYIDFGLSIISKESFKLYNKNSIFDLSDYFAYLVKNKSLLGYKVENRFYEIGSFQGIKELEKIL